VRLVYMIASAAKPGCRRVRSSWKNSANFHAVLHILEQLTRELAHCRRTTVFRPPRASCAHDSECGKAGVQTRAQLEEQREFSRGSPYPRVADA